MAYSKVCFLSYKMRYHLNLLLKCCDTEVCRRRSGHRVRDFYFYAYLLIDSGFLSETLYRRVRDRLVCALVCFDLRLVRPALRAQLLSDFRLSFGEFFSLALRVLLVS